MELAQFTAEMRPPGQAIAVPTVEAIYATGHWLLERDRSEDAAKVFRVMLHAAPGDERGWLGLGECHERIGQLRIALELYGAGSVAAGPSPRCHLARVRTLRALERDEEAERALDAAARDAERLGDSELVALVEQVAREPARRAP
jgi:hypothetical protein